MTLETIDRAMSTLEGSNARVSDLIAEIFEALGLQETPTEAPPASEANSRLDKLEQRIFAVHRDNQQQVDRLQTVIAELVGVDGPPNPAANVITTKGYS